MTADFPNYLLEMLSPDRIALEDKDEVIVRVSDNSIIVNQDIIQINKQRWLFMVWFIIILDS